jgi:D-arabinose 1-dehydrogenase-like Zn-dependent alcohol dehydrogenase
MKAVVFHRPGHIEVNQVPDPKIEHDEDIIFRVTSTAICARCSGVLRSSGIKGEVVAR